MQIILFEPEIPQNTGNIIRTCYATNCGLTLVKPLGFSLSDRKMKRAGLDYGKDFTLNCIEDLETFLEKQKSNFYFFSSKAQKSYTDIAFTEDDLLIFGSETAGLPEKYHTKWPDRFYTIPMKRETRCLNLSNSTAIIIYEACRQLNFTFHERKE
jgi:tRNA (cytidine/uridine-2'-O-)-methyltransferase